MSSTMQRPPPVHTRSSSVDSAQSAVSYNNDGPRPRRRRNSKIGEPPAQKAVLRGQHVPIATVEPSGARDASEHVYPDGTRYIGEWRDDVPHGEGTCVFPSKNVYMGEWRDGSIAGAGVMLYADGTIFDGWWRDGECDGPGTVFPVDGPPTSGVWARGKQVATTALPAGASGDQKRALLTNIARSLRGAPVSNEPFDRPSGTVTPSQSPATRPGLGESAPAIRIDSPPAPNAGELLPPPALGAAAAADGACDPKRMAAEDAVHAVLFAAAGPSYTTEFIFSRFLRYLVALLLPMFAIPHMPCPLRTNVLDLEREYVVSGAALRLDFEAPVGEVYVALFAVVTAFLTLIFAALTPPALTPTSELSITDVAAPFTACVLFALINAGYQSYVRVAHALERLDRYQFPRFAKFSASCVDSTTHTCVDTWDEDGENVIRTPKYPRRWVLLGICVGVLVALASPITRVVNGHSFMATTHVLSLLSALFSAMSLLVSTTGTVYYFFKIFDMQRQVLGRMRVMSTCAYMKGQSVLRPTDQRRVKFALDSSLDFRDFNEGFVGWYTTRCFVLYASTCSNHEARMTAMSAVSVFVLGVYLAAIGDFVYASVQGFATTDTYFTAAHMMAIVVMLTLAKAHIAYLFVCLNTDKERAKHIYLADVTALLQYSRGSAHSAAIVTHCRDVIANHDVRYKVMSIVVSGRVLWLTIIVHTVALLCLALHFSQWLIHKG